MDDEQIWRTACESWSLGAETIRGLTDAVDPAAFSRCVRMLAECRGRIVTSGAGTSGAAAWKIAHTLSCIERPAFFLEPAEAAHGGLGAVKAGDVVLLISKGGATREIAELLPALRARESFIIGVTENASSPVGRDCDLLLRIAIRREADSFNMLATTSILAVLAVFDAVCIALMTLSGFTRERFALIHPGGAVGERLRKGED